MGFAGAFSGATVLWKRYSGGFLLGSSSIFPSVEVWKRLSSTENGEAPFLSFGIGISFFLRN